MSSTRENLAKHDDDDDGFVVIEETTSPKYERSKTPVRENPLPLPSLRSKHISNYVIAPEEKKTEVKELPAQTGGLFTSWILAPVLKTAKQLITGSSPDSRGTHTWRRVRKKKYDEGAAIVKIGTQDKDALKLYISDHKLSPHFHPTTHQRLYN